MDAMLAITQYQWMGIGGMLFGMLVLVNVRRITNLLNTLQRAEADVVQRVTPKRGREIVSIWMRVGTGGDIASRWYRYSITVMIGLIAFFVGLAALLGAWAESP
jgi:hypothetical protein